MKTVAVRLLPRLSTLGIVFVILLAGACQRGASVFPSAPVVLISVDTLRADHLPAYGYRGVDTPNLDALRRDAVLFTNAYSHVPLTLPSHVSLMTGLLPPQNGVRDNIGYALGPGPETLAGLLKKRGWATGGAISTIILSRATGINRGFDFYDDEVEPTEANQSLGRVQRNGGETEASLARWVEQQRTPRIFAFLHLYEPHTPYEPPEPYKSRYPLAYDGEIARSDEIVGDFIRVLKRKGLYDGSIVLFLSDHGEGLNDHGEAEHGVLLYREAIHVPLFLKLPKSRHAGETVSTPVALTDVFPTVASLLGLTPPARLAGVSLTTVMEGKAAPRRVYSETLYPRLHLGWSDLASLVDDRWHYIEAPRSELYDEVTDPVEKKDLASSLPPAFRSLRAELARMPRPTQAPGLSDPEQVKKLAALGYISATAPDLSTKNLPDPKDRIGVIEELKTGFGDLQSNQYAKAATLFRRLLASNPGMTDVWQFLATADTKLGNDREAFEALQKAIRLSPGNPQILLALADFYLETGNYEEARKHVLLARDVGAADVHENLARIALEEKDFRTAETETREAIREHPERSILHMLLARVRKEQGDLVGALEELNKVSGQPGAKHEARPNLNAQRGDVLARLGRDAEAEAAFREEIKDFSDSVAAWTGLALLYASEGKQAETRQALDTLANFKTPPALFAAARAYEVLGDSQTAARLRREVHELFPLARERKKDVS